MPRLKNEELIIQSQLLNWYKKNKRILPWRKLLKNNLPNPYFIFVSEYMLQQTTVNTVIIKFVEFIGFWPNLKKLSATRERRILRFWSGLGYYARAKNLLKSSKIISKQFNNRIPDKYEDLINLPGIGEYTAKAILGIAYNQPTMPVEANIERIIARLYCLKKPIKKIKKNISFFATKFISKKQSSNLIQAFMDYGSIICTPRNPKCSFCVIAKHCIANKKNLVSLIPKKNTAIIKKPTKYTRAYIILNNLNEVLVRRRPDKGMLPSMLEVPNDLWVTQKKFLKKDPLTKKFKKFSRCDSILYSFSHFDLKVDIYLTKQNKVKIKNYEWILFGNIASSGMPTIMKKIVTAAIN